MGVHAMTSTMTVRQAGLSDLEALVPLLDAYRQFYGRESDLAAARVFLKERFNHGESVLFIAFDGDAAIGFAQLYPSFSSAALARTFILNDLFVAESSRKRGAGSQLMQAVVAFARELGAVRLTLSTAVSNETAQSLYESCGWQRDEQFVVYHYALDAWPGVIRSKSEPACLKSPYSW